MSFTNKRPAIKSMDDIFRLSEYTQGDQVTIIQTPIDDLTPFSKHPFRLYDGERLDDMVASIKANGILVPIIVRDDGDTLEILAGHNRANAARLAGLVKIPSIVLKDVTDEEAMAYVVETNLMQRSFSEMTHTEKAAVIAMHHSKMFSQGKRNDILEQLKMLENPLDTEEDGTCGQLEHKLNETESGTCAQLEHKLKSREKVAKEYGLDRNTVARYLRIDRLVPELKVLLDSGKLKFIPAVTLSFLTEEEQRMLAGYISEDGVTIDMKKAEAMRQYSARGALEGMNLFLILTGGTGDVKQATKATKTVKLEKSVYERYFKPGQSAEEVQAIIDEALSLYFTR